MSTVEELAHLREPEKRTEDPVAACSKRNQKARLQQLHKMHKAHITKLSTVYGEEGKEDISCATCKFEVDALISNRILTDEQI